MLDKTKLVESYIFNVPVDTTQSYNAYFMVNDGDFNDITSFDMKNGLIRQSITRETISTNTTTTTETSESKDDANYPIAFSMISIITVVTLNLKRKKPSRK